MTKLKHPLTSREIHLLHFIIDSPSTFNGDRIDLYTPFERQSWEDRETWWGYAELNDYVALHGKAMGMTVRSAKGVLGSLVKKGYLSTCDDGDFITIGKEQFEKIRAFFIPAMTNGTLNTRLGNGTPTDKEV